VLGITEENPRNERNHVGTAASPVRPEPALRERSEPKGRSPGSPKPISVHKQKKRTQPFSRARLSGEQKL
jgi:hypothetical protein